MHKLISWLPVLHAEAWFPILAQADTVIEKGYGAVMKGGAEFGHADDAVKFGITLFALIAIMGALAYLYERRNLLEIKELKAENKTLRDEIKTCTKTHEAKYDELRANCDKKTEGFWGILQVAVAEVAAMNKVMQSMGVHIHRPPMAMLPPTPVTEPQGRSGQFLPPRQRRIQPRPEGEPRDEE